MALALRSATSAHLITRTAGSSAPVFRGHTMFEIASNWVFLSGVPNYNEVTAKLENLRNHSTLYEVVICHSSGRSRLIGYGRKSRSGLIATVQQKGDEILRVVDIPEDFNGAITAHSMDLSGGWIAKFSGRTQRQSIIEGELIGL